MNGDIIVNKDFKDLIDFKDIKSGCKNSEDSRHGSHSRFAFLDRLFCEAVHQMREEKTNKKMSETLAREFPKYMKGTGVEELEDLYVDAGWFYDKTFSKYKGSQPPVKNKDNTLDIHLRIFSYYLGKLCEEKEEEFSVFLEEFLEREGVSAAGSTSREKLHYMLRMTFGDLYRKHYALDTGLTKYVAGSKTLTEGALVNPEEGKLGFTHLTKPSETKDLLSSYGVTIGHSPFMEKIKVAYLPIYSIASELIIDKQHFVCNIDDRLHWKITDEIKDLLEDGIDKDEWIREKVEEERSDAKNRGYYDQPDLLWVRSITFDDRKMLTIDFGNTEEGGYLYHKVWKNTFFDVCSENRQKAENNRYLSLLDNPADKLTGFMVRENGPFHTTRAGGGIWIITSDGYIACSKRGANLRDEPGKISYSASGSFENTGWDSKKGVRDPHGEYGPFSQISKEVKEELGIALSTDDIRMSEIGIDLYGGWIQFSFFAVVPYTAAELSAQRNRAVDKKEFTLFFIPFSEAESMLFYSNPSDGAIYSMEESARYSLYHIITEYPK